MTVLAERMQRKGRERPMTPARAASMTSPDSAIPNSASPRPTTVSRPPSQAHTSGHGTEDGGADGLEDGGGCGAEDRGIGDC